MREPRESAPKELLYCWMSTTLEVLVPKKRGAGFLSVPYGHHENPGLAKIASACGSDIYGLDGSLSFQCGMSVAIDEARRKAFEEKVLPLLASHYGWPVREIAEREFWTLHPVPHEAQESSGPGLG